MIVLYILGGLLLLLLLALLIPVRAEVSFREEFTLTLRYLFLRFPLLPAREKPEEPEEQKEPEQPEEDKAKKSSGGFDVKTMLKRTGFKGFLDTLFEMVGMAGHAGKGILSHLRLLRFDLYLRVGGSEDAAAGAILYGQLCAGVYPACGVLFRLWRCRKRAVSIDLSYDEAENLVDFSGSLSLRPIFAAGYGLALAVRLLPKAIKLLRAGRPVQKPASSGQRPGDNERKVSVNE